MFERNKLISCVYNDTNLASTLHSGISICMVLRITSQIEKKGKFQNIYMPVIMLIDRHMLCMKLLLVS